MQRVECKSWQERGKYLRQAFESLIWVCGMPRTYPVEVVYARTCRKVNNKACRFTTPRFVIEYPEQLHQLVSWFALHIEALQALLDFSKESSPICTLLT